MYAENLKKIRKELDLSMIELSEKIDISPNTISAYERNIRTPSLDFGARLYEKLNVNLNWFVSGEGEMFNAPQFEDVRADILKEVEIMLKKRGL